MIPRQQPMNMKIDFKSALLGLALGILATVAVAGATSPGPVGRYQVGATSNQALVLDTATGRVWSAFCSSTEGRTDPDFYKIKAGEGK
jgi:hypothetical protein